MACDNVTEKLYSLRTRKCVVVSYTYIYAYKRVFKKTVTLSQSAQSLDFQWFAGKTKQKITVTARHDLEKLSRGSAKQ